MTILLPDLGVTFAAFGVGLTVRIVNRRERWARWTLAGLVIVFVLYPLSIGPVGWVKTRFAAPTGMFNDALGVIYMPVLIAALHGPEPIRHAFQWYGRLWGLEGGD
jgi:hypothetical protein